MNEKLKKFKDLIEEQKKMKDRPQTVLEEIFNAVTHGAGVFLSIAALVVLLGSAIINGKSLTIITGVSIFGTTSIFLYLMSSLYHSLSKTKAKDLFKLLDHSAIFILIAGSYTPIVLTIGGIWGWTLFGIVWFLTLTGIVLEAVFKSRVKKLSMFIYLAMGWIIIFAWNPMLNSIHYGFIKWIFAGGFFYTAGVVFYIMPGKKYFHVFWHFMVLAGTVMHFFGILFYISS